MARFIGYPSRQVLAVFEDGPAAEEAVRGLGAIGVAPDGVDIFEGAADASRFDATGSLHGVRARVRRAMQFSLMDQLPAMAWYEAALREGRRVVAVRTTTRASTLEVVEVLKASGGHFINRFGRFDTEEFARWRGSEPAVSDLMRH